MNVVKSIALIFLLSCLTWVGCGAPYQPVPYIINESSLLENNQDAGKALVKKAKGRLDKDKPIITASFVNLNQLFKSSSFGRISSQQVASQFTNDGYHVIEMLLRKDVYIKAGEGEFLLSRELKDISKKHEAQAVLVGTYVSGDYYVYVTAKIVDAQTNIVIASHAYKVPFTKDTKTLVDN